MYRDIIFNAKKKWFSPTSRNLITSIFVIACEKLAFESDIIKIHKKWIS